jgi:hypothetical protein
VSKPKRKKTMRIVADVRHPLFDRLWRRVLDERAANACSIARCLDELDPYKAIIGITLPLDVAVELRQWCERFDWWPVKNWTPLHWMTPTRAASRPRHKKVEPVFPNALLPLLDAAEMHEIEAQARASGVDPLDLARWKLLRPFDIGPQAGEPILRGPAEWNETVGRVLRNLYDEGLWIVETGEGSVFTVRSRGPGAWSEVLPTRLELSWAA